MAAREARLRPEWADLYPGVQPDIWHVAAELVPHVLRHRLRNQGAWEFTRRILLDDHFEFRGGKGARCHLDRCAHPRGGRLM